MTNYYIPIMRLRRRNNHQCYPQKYFILAMNRYTKSPLAGANRESSTPQAVHARNLLSESEILEWIS
jgi:hypothetical protein